MDPAFAQLATPTWIKKLNFQGPPFLECPDDLQALALQFPGAPQEMHIDCFVDAWRMHLRRPLEKKARIRTGRRADTGEDSSREAMTQTGLEDLLEEALIFCFKLALQSCSEGLCLQNKFEFASSPVARLLANTFGAIARTISRATPEDSGVSPRSGDQ